MATFWCLLLALPLTCLAVQSTVISPSGDVMVADVAKERRPTSTVYRTEVNISKYLEACPDRRLPYKDLAQSSNTCYGSCTLPQSLKFGELQGGTKLLADAISSDSLKTTPFLWLRYGDGEFASMTSMNVGNSDGADMNSQCVRDGLIEAFLGDSMPGTPVVVSAVGGFFLCKETHASLNQNMDTFAAAHSQHKNTYVNQFYLPFDWATLPQSKRPVVLVGPKHLDALHCMLGHVAFFEVPLPTNGCGDVDGLVSKMTEISQTQYPTQSVFFVVAGGGIGKIVGYKAFQKLQDKDSIVDVGSSLDGYAGKASRDYNRDIKKFCKGNTKQWMAHDVCQSECQDVDNDLPCKQCK